MDIAQGAEGFFFPTGTTGNFLVGASQATLLSLVGVAMSTVPQS